MTGTNEVAADAASPRPHTVTVTVNGRPVVLPDHEATGLEIKRAAIAQGLPDDEGFQPLRPPRQRPLPGRGR
jgi:hypothetical protein